MRLNRFLWWCLCLLSGAAPVAWAQTPSPLPEWQFSAGELLRTALDPDPPVWSRMVGLSTESLPRYDGARDNRWLTGPVFDLRYRDIAYFSSGEGLGVNLLHSKQYRAGTALTYDLGRPERRDAVLQGVGNIPATAQWKVYGEYLVFPVMLRAAARRAIAHDDGWVGDLSVYLPLFGNERVFLLAGPSVTMADSGHLRRWFGVDAAQSQASGLPQYRPAGGLLSASMGFDLTWLITDHWFFNGAAGGQRLMGEAAHSPLVRDPQAYSFDLTAGYQW